MFSLRLRSLVHGPRPPGGFCCLFLVLVSGPCLRVVAGCLSRRERVPRRVLGRCGERKTMCRQVLITSVTGQDASWDGTQNSAFTDKQALYLTGQFMTAKLRGPTS